MRWSCLVGLTALAVACATKNPEQAFLSQIGTLTKDEILARGDALMEKKHYEEGRRYYSFLADAFPNDPVGRQAALKTADSYLRGGDAESVTEAQLRYKDFANRFPNDPQRAYALLMLGKTYWEQRRGPMRDLTPLREAAASFKQVVELFPSSQHAAEAQELLAKCEEDLAEHELAIARYYVNIDAWQGAYQRLSFLLANYPRSTAAKDASELLARVEAHRQPPPAESAAPPITAPPAPPRGR